jgi:hypothetical protein
MARKGKARRQGSGPSKDDVVRQQRVLAVLRTSGKDPISFFCSILENEDATDEQRKEAAEELLPYFHARLARAGPLLARFLCQRRK